mmetsp:Transcript_12123/g.25596  ORF Transcript_12123/g.25596 Transcript_12123/m.25596 type:complete len:84 (+) Transcript_12123:4399-4650(+)
MISTNGSCTPCRCSRSRGELTSEEISCEDAAPSTAASCISCLERRAQQYRSTSSRKSVPRVGKEPLEMEEDAAASGLINRLVF